MKIEQFEYDTRHNFQTNFIVWFNAANKERDAWHEPPLNEEEAYDIFVGQYGHHQVA
jgi:hypothetical protein